MQQGNKPFAPFGAVICQLRLELKSIQTSPYIFVGRYAEQEARKFWTQGYIALCLPIGKNVTDYSWPVKDLSLIIYDTGSMASLGLKKIATHLLRCGAKITAIFSEMNHGIDIYQLKKDLQHGTNENT